MLRSWRTSDLAMHGLYQRKMEVKEIHSLTESLQRRTHTCMIRVFKVGEKMVRRSWVACFAALAQGSVAGSYREALNELYIQPHTTTLTSILTTSPTIVCITTSSPLTQSSAMVVKPITGVCLPIGTLGPWTNGANVSALDAPSWHRARPHSCSWSVTSSKRYAIAFNYYMSCSIAVIDAR